MGNKVTSLANSETPVQKVNQVQAEMALNRFMKKKNAIAKFAAVNKPVQVADTYSGVGNISIEGFVIYSEVSFSFTIDDINLSGSQNQWVASLGELNGLGPAIFSEIPASGSTSTYNVTGLAIDGGGAIAEFWDGDGNYQGTITVAGVGEYLGNVNGSVTWS